ncbi:hypothetical protein B0H14DRAFT_2506295 [Mycena olivaceomarginata]|nr:hypothetical protein B0H14DRAFT_2506295 [Mycena olivaceomarginata]
MRPRSTPSPKSSSYPQSDVATYRDLLLFEERLKSTAASLQRRKSRYQRTVLPLPLCRLSRFLLLEVLLPPDVSLLAIPCKLVLQRLLPDIYTAEREVHIHPFVSTGMLFVSVTTLALFFASGTYADKIAYANKYVPHANRALRSFNMYLNVRQPPLRSKLKIGLNPLAFFFPRPEPPSPTSTSSSTSSSRSSAPAHAAPQPIGSTSTSVPIPPIPPTTNPRGELRLSSRVDRAFRDGYERYRATFERKRAAQAEVQRKRAQAERWWWWWRRGRDEAPTSGTSGSATGRATGEISRSGTPRQREKERDLGGGGRQRSGSPLRLSIAERRSTGTPAAHPASESAPCGLV